MFQKSPTPVRSERLVKTARRTITYLERQVPNAHDSFLDYRILPSKEIHNFGIKCELCFNHEGNK